MKQDEQQWCASTIFVESESSKIFSSRDLAELSQSSHKNCRVTSSHWFASSSQMIFPICSMTCLWYEMVPNIQ